MTLFPTPKCVVIYATLLFAVFTSAVPYFGEMNYQMESTMNQNGGEYRLIQTSDEYPPAWLSQDMILDLIRKRIKFMDITDYTELGSTVKTFYTKRAYPATPSFQNEVNQVIGNLTTKHMKKNLETFTNFRTRYYKSSYGARSSNWLFDQISNIIKSSGREDITIARFKHKWAQKSIIVRFEGSDPNSSNDVVIVGAHQDSVNMWFPPFGRAPGADDDGSGTVTILETFRSLVSCNFQPAIPVEFHWYSAEEGGLLGSQDIALKYEKDKKNVIAMLQNDMTGYIGEKKESIGVVIDHVDADLTDFIGKLAKAYANIPIVKTKCGYACSDHASWSKAGYPSAFVIEGDFDDTNPYIHSSSDVIENLSFEHMLEFAKLSVSFAVELSHTNI